MKRAEKNETKLTELHEAQSDTQPESVLVKSKMWKRME